MGVEYITDGSGQKKAVVVPINEWNTLLEIVETYKRSEEETAYLLKSEAMRKRLMEAMAGTGGKSLDEVKDALGL